MASYFSVLSLSLAAASLLAIAPTVLAADAGDGAKTFKVTEDKHNQAEASFTSRAALVRLTGRTSKVGGEATIPLQNVAKAAGVITVDLSNMDTGIALRNEHMRGMIDADKFPIAVFKFASIKVPGNQLKSNMTVTGQASGFMAFHGVTRSMVAPVELTYLPEPEKKYRAGDWVQLSSRFKLKLSDYGIELPGAMLDIKVADELDIQIDGMAKAQ